MSRALLFRLEYSRKTNLHHQCGKESDDERQHRIDPNADHADLVSKDVAALLGGEFYRHRTLTHDQAAHDFHRGSVAVHLGLSNGSLARLVKSLRSLAARIDFGANPIHLDRKS